MLAERTEGWVAGVRLSAMRMEGSEAPERFVTGFAMDRGSIGEYLMEEVLGTQPVAVQKLLIRSSICDPVTGPLEDAICENESGSSVLRVTSRCRAGAGRVSGARAPQLSIRFGRSTELRLTVPRWRVVR
jgi:LuxR family maltose regulon positive regulatory protein